MTFQALFSRPAEFGPYMPILPGEYYFEFLLVSQYKASLIGWKMGELKKWKNTYQVKLSFVGFSYRFSKALQKLGLPKHLQVMVMI